MMAADNAWNNGETAEDSKVLDNLPYLTGTESQSGQLSSRAAAHRKLNEIVGPDAPTAMYLPQVVILKRPGTAKAPLNTSQRQLPATSEQSPKSLASRRLEYAKARARIFGAGGDDQSCDKPALRRDEAKTRKSQAVRSSNVTREPLSPADAKTNGFALRRTLP